jgi:hypothetical protein
MIAEAVIAHISIIGGAFLFISSSLVMLIFHFY